MNETEEERIARHYRFIQQFEDACADKKLNLPPVEVVIDYTDRGWSVEASIVDWKKQSSQ